MGDDQVSNKIGEIFAFLVLHHDFNRRIQYEYVRQTLSACDSPRERMRLLLERAVNSQSQPKLDKVSEFWKSLQQNNDALKSYTEFLKFVRRTSHPDLMTALSHQPGWGHKTAALFVRNLWIASHEKSLKKLVWGDVDLNNERVYLPVDKVIQHIFSRIDGKNQRSFDSINKQLSTLGYQKSEHMLIWDDLWFWGFISQRGSGERIFEWNDAKYWSIFTAAKDATTIKEIKKLTNEFLRLTKPL